jgi:pteridine reductase
MKLAGRVGLVTGAGRRVGKALALALGDESMRVAVHYNTAREGAEEVVRQIVDRGGEAEVFHADLGDQHAPADLVDRVQRHFGALDVVINSAAVMERTPVGEVTPEMWDRIFAVNLRAPFFIAQAAAPCLRAARGAIVNIADLAAFESWPGYVPHSISKAGIVKMTAALARVFAPDVRVNAIAPGAVLLPEEWDESTGERLAQTTPLARLGDPEDVVYAMMYLLRAGYVTGETLIVDGGRHIRK